MMKILIKIAVLSVLPVLAVASGGGDEGLDPVEINLADQASLQRGAKTFVNSVCRVIAPPTCVTSAWGPILE